MRDSADNLSTDRSAYGKIFAVVVTFHPDTAFPERLARLAKQADTLLIVDNHSGEPTVSMLRKVAAENKARLVLNSENMGVAAALNIGVKAAIEEGYPWVATFDQDSAVSEHYFDILLKAYEMHEFKGKIAILAPIYRDEAIIDGGDAERHPNPPFVEIDKTMTSGCLVKVDCFRSVGFFDESLFIDLVDHEFSLRAMKAGYRLVQSKTCVLLHRLGKPARHRLFGRYFYTTEHDQSRRYYMARNRVLVYRKYATFKPFWILRDASSFLKEQVKIILVEKNATSKLSATALGLLDGIRKRTGRFDQLHP